LKASIGDQKTPRSHNFDHDRQREVVSVMTHKDPWGRINVDVISYATDDSALGRVLVARSTSGVCCILLGTDDAELVTDLTNRFPEAKLVANEDAVRDDLAKVTGFVDKPSRGLDLTLDLRGTQFQRRVWEALRAIPVGNTITYGELARSIGEPHSVRAVGAACASNPIALAVPCHRAVGSNGDLTGYRWGIERKHELLKKETAA
jgi:AraC family transcriptional regulator, regulatory protein of adaptative response / methylated-DNA-[protein]-cysteine methyltransferase